MRIVSVQDAAILLGVSDRRVRQLCAAGRIKHQQVGRAYLIDERALKAFAQIERKPGNHITTKKGK